MKGLSAFTLFTTLCFSLSFGKQVVVKTPSEFIQLFESETRVTDHIVLANDLDFSEENITAPLGMHDGTCFSFGGILDGKGHTITMLNVTSEGNAGLFCSVEEATIQNLVIDSSCLFSGESAGALCPFAMGSITVKNITNRATVYGTRILGGLIGYVTDLLGPTSVLIDNCSNDAIIDRFADYCGGFVGPIYNNTRMTFVISNCRNNATLTRCSDQGAFVGNVGGNKDINITISSSTNNCTIYGGWSNGGLISGIDDNIDIIINVSDVVSHCILDDGSYSSGFIGGLYNNTNMVATISNSQVSGAIIRVWSATGLLAGISKCTNATVTISNCTNIMDADTEYRAGFIDLVSDNHDISLLFSGCTNNANITQTPDYASGFVRALSGNSNLNITLSSSINNGIVKSKYNGGGFIGISEKNSKANIVFFNCTNHGQTLGKAESHKLGGFIGVFSNNNETNMMILNSENNGPVTGKYDQVGGFIGYIANNNNSKVLVSKSMNHGEITGTSKVGGFVGFISENIDIEVSFVNNINDGNVSGSEDSISGFIGFIQSNDHLNLGVSNVINEGDIGESNSTGGIIGHVQNNIELSMYISKGINNGTIYGDEKLGGIIGEVYDNSNMMMSISKCSNNGSVSGNKTIGGLIGSISFVSESLLPSSLFSNNENQGNVSASQGSACGLFCVEETQNKNVNITILNSINKGNVSATVDAYGITTIVTMANNVVSMGIVLGESESYSFWKHFKDVELLYAVKDQCINWNINTTLFEYNETIGFFEAVESGDHVDDLLNDQVEKQKYAMMWTSNLDLFEPNVEPSSSSSLSSRQSGPLSVSVLHASSFILSCLGFILTTYLALSQW